MRVVAVIIALLVTLVHASEARAHASLVRAEPADGTILAQPPTTLKLIFNEPVSPLIMRLLGPNGETITPTFMTEDATVTVMPPQLREGTHVLSWRVTSTDGHPLGGALLFSVGAPSAAPAVGQLDIDPAVKLAIWATKLVLYVGLFVGIGGAAFTALIVDARPLPARLETWLAGLMAGGIIAAVLSLGLQGLDAVALPLRELWRPAIWSVALSTSYAFTTVIALFALILGLAALRTSTKAATTLLALGAITGLALALAASGHASTAEPRSISRASVFLHVLLVAFWIGSLLPLVAIVRDSHGNERALARFSRAIPFALVALAGSGLFLIYGQLDRIDALWTTNYGVVLSAKLAAVLALLGLGAANRYRFVPQFEALGATAARPLVRSIAIEVALAVAILGIVALWRFTPPPRAIVVAEPISIHIHSPQAMALIEVESVRARGATVVLQVSDKDLEPLTAKEVTLVLSNPAAGIEPFRRAAVSDGDATWHIDDLRVPVAGRWHLRVEILINDFEKVTLEDDVELPRAP